MSGKKHVLICGPRGTGKKRLAHSIAESIEKSGDISRLVKINLEDPRHAPGPRPETIDLYAKLGHEKESTLLVVEELGSISRWPELIDKIDRYIGVKFIITISGNVDHIKRRIRQHDDLEIIEHFAPGFGSYVAGMNIKTNLDNLCSEFLFRDAEDGDNLISLFREIIFLDVVCKHEVREVKKLTDMAVYLVESSGASVSANVLKKHSLGSLDMARAFLGYLEESGLIILVNRIEDADRARNEAARLCIAGDTRLVQRLSRGPLDGRRLAVTAVYHELRRLTNAIFSWRLDGREGLLVKKKGNDLLAVDVFWDDEPEAERRIARVMARYGSSDGLLLRRGAGPRKLKVRAGTIHTCSLSQWLLAPWLEQREAGTAEMPGAPVAQMPAHLL